MDYTTAAVTVLIRACVDGEPEAWQEFIRRFHRIITITAYRVARRWGANSPAVVDDLTQDMYLKLCARGGRVLREFNSPDPDGIFAFLKVVTTNVVNDYFKGIYASKRGGSQGTESLDEVEPKRLVTPPAGCTGVERDMLLDEVDACLCAVAPVETKERDRMIFWLYYRQGMTANEIAELGSVGLGVKGVESTLHRLTHLVRDRLAARQSGNLTTGEKSREKGF